MSLFTTLTTKIVAPFDSAQGILAADLLFKMLFGQDVSIKIGQDVIGHPL